MPAKLYITTYVEKFLKLTEEQRDTCLELERQMIQEVNDLPHDTFHERRMRAIAALKVWDEIDHWIDDRLTE